ncbi:MAG: O-methyltransferase [Bacillota bacterium]
MDEFPGQINDQYHKKYIRNIVKKESNEYIFNLGKNARKRDIPIIDIEVKKFLEVLIKSSNIKSILEIGTAIGYSSLVFCKAMDYKGYIKSYDNDKPAQLKAKKHFEKFSKKYDVDLDIDLVYGNAKTCLKDEKEIYDLIFIDAAKGHYQKFFDQMKDNLKKGSIIVSDNVLFKGMVATDKYVVKRQRTIAKRMRNYLEFLTNCPYLETSVIPIGDGLAVSYVTGGEDYE